MIRHHTLPDFSRPRKQQRGTRSDRKTLKRTDHGLFTRVDRILRKGCRYGTTCQPQSTRPSTRPSVFDFSVRVERIAQGRKVGFGPCIVTSSRRGIVFGALSVVPSFEEDGAPNPLCRRCRRCRPPVPSSDRSRSGVRRSNHSNSLSSSSSSSPRSTPSCAFRSSKSETPPP